MRSHLLSTATSVRALCVWLLVALTLAMGGCNATPRKDENPAIRLPRSDAKLEEIKDVRVTSEGAVAILWRVSYFYGDGKAIPDSGSLRWLVINPAEMRDYLANSENRRVQYLSSAVAQPGKSVIELYVTRGVADRSNPEQLRKIYRIHPADYLRPDATEDDLPSQMGAWVTPTSRKLPIGPDAIWDHVLYEYQIDGVGYELAITGWKSNLIMYATGDRQADETRDKTRRLMKAVVTAPLKVLMLPVYAFSAWMVAGAFYPG